MTYLGELLFDVLDVLIVLAIGAGIFFGGYVLGYKEGVYDGIEEISKEAIRRMRRTYTWEDPDGSS